MHIVFVSLVHYLSLHVYSCRGFLYIFALCGYTASIIMYSYVGYICLVCFRWVYIASIAVSTSGPTET